MDILANPDRLCAVASALDDINVEALRISSGSGSPQTRNESAKKKGLKPGARALNALARLVLFEPKQHAIAVGAVLDPHGGLELYLAGNSEVLPKMVQHVSDICGRLISIRDAIYASPNRTALLSAIERDPFLLNHDTTEPDIASLAELQRVLLSYSLDLLRARFAKGAWGDRLAYVVACIEGDTKVLADMSEGERVHLTHMQQGSSSMQEDLLGLASAVCPLIGRIGEGQEIDLDELRHASATMLHFITTTKLFMAHLDRFMNAHLLRTTGIVPRKHPHFAKWLHKASFVLSEYKALVKFLLTPALSGLLGTHISVHAVAVAPMARPCAVRLTRENIRDAFAALGYTPETFVIPRPEEFHDLVEEVENAAKDSDANRIHCESALLYYLDLLGQGMMPYIGASKPCALCDLYFSAYREHNGVEVHAHGTSPDPDAAMMLDFSDSTDFKVLFGQKVGEYIKARLADEASRRWGSNSDYGRRGADNA